jgi:multidrug transporter EmrE-like cation transporter
VTNLSIVLILVSVCMSAIAQILLKGGMSSVAVQRALSEPGAIGVVFAIATNLTVLAGLVVYFCSALVWLLVLSKVEVSVAYPFVALGFVLTAVLGYLLFEEPLTMYRILGILLVCTGVAVLARG